MPAAIPAMPGTDADLLQQAAEWYAILRADDATDEERHQWKDWLARDPAHAQAWRRIESVSRRFASLHDAGGPQAVVAGAKAARRIVMGRRKVLRSLAGLAGLGLAGWAGWRHTPMPALMAGLGADYRTTTGQRREVRLADGTRLWLNTRSAVDIDYGPSRRAITLLDGEILVETARDEARRPFYVWTGCGRVEALGTRFTVRREGSGARVDVHEGLVEIRNHAGQVRRVPAGYRARFDETAIGAIETADPAREAWTRGIVMANDLTLQALADELSRYWHGHIHVAPEVAGLKVIGVYPADDVGRALHMIASELPVRVSRPLPWWTTLARR